MSRLRAALPEWVETLALLSLFAASLVSTAALAYSRGVAEGVDAAETTDTIVRVRMLGSTGSWLAGFHACTQEEKNR